MIYLRILLICLLLTFTDVFSQTTGNRTVSLTLPVITLMDVEPPGAITLNYTAPTEAGNPLVKPDSDTTKWINYTSAITSGGLTRRITASINQFIPGISIGVVAAPAAGSGGGTRGTPTSQITLSTNAQTIISGIGGAFTGNGASNGHKLTISLATNTYANLRAILDTQIIIIYTIIE